MKLPLALLLLIPFAGTAAIPTPTKGATRLKDLISIEGIRENQLVGYGVVVGLNATGDKRQTVFSAQSLSNVLERMGITVSPTALRVANTAAVMLTATLPAFAQPGTRIDVTASAVGDASNLQGGVLLMTSLLAANGQVYAVAQGPVVTGGFVAGKGGTNQTVNHPTVGRVPNGATIEQAAPSIAPTSIIRLQLRSADFATSARIADAINEHLGKTIHIAQAENSALISVETPAEWKGRMTEFIASIEDLRVAVDAVAKVVVNERTGKAVHEFFIGFRWDAVKSRCIAVQDRDRKTHENHDGRRGSHIQDCGPAADPPGDGASPPQPGDSRPQNHRRRRRRQTPARCRGHTHWL